MIQDERSLSKTSISSCTSSYDTIVSNLCIKKHEIPSTSAATIIATENASSRLSSLASSHQQEQEPPRKNILRKSSAFFSEKVLKKKSSIFTFHTTEPVPTIPKQNNTKHSLDRKKGLSPGVAIKQQPTATQKNPTSNRNATWWRRVFTRD
jgi:hypothetical protein